MSTTSSVYHRTAKNALVDQPRRRQLRPEPIAEHLGEPALVVIVPPLAVVVHRSNVNDDVAGVQDCGIARALEVCVRVLVDAIDGRRVFKYQRSRMSQSVSGGIRRGPRRSETCHCASRSPGRSQFLSLSVDDMGKERCKHTFWSSVDSFTFLLGCSSVDIDLYFA